MTDVKTLIENGVCTLTLNRANKKNALTPSMYEALAEGIALAEQDLTCRVVVLRAAGEDFTAGNDLSEFASGNQDNLAHTVAFMKALMYCKLPVVAEVKGKAIGIGTTMLLHCDVVIASKEASFMMPFINLALVPEYASSYLLPFTTGHINAVKWLMLGESMDAESVYSQGLITEIVNADNLTETIEQVCKKLASKPKQAMLSTKALLRHNLKEVQDVIDRELTVFAAALESESAKEAFDAFLNKRPINPSRFLN